MDQDTPAAQPPASVDAQAFLAAIAASPQILFSTLEALVLEQGPQALRKAGMPPATLGSLIFDALSQNALKACHPFAISCLTILDRNAEDLSYGLAILAAFERAAASGSGLSLNFAQHAQDWHSIEFSQPELARRLAQSPAVRLSASTFWSYVADCPWAWDDEIGLTALRLHAGRAASGGGMPTHKALSEASPPMLSAIAQGAADKLQWRFMDGFLEILDDMRPAGARLARLAPVAHSIVEATARMMGQAPSEQVFSIISHLAGISEPAAIALAAQIAAVPIDLRDLDGNLREPSLMDESVPPSQSWRAPRGSPSSSLVDLASLSVANMPSVMLPAGTVMAHWRGPLGRRIAEGAGLSSTPLSMQIFDALKRLGSLADPAERAAAFEAVALIVANPPEQTAAPARPALRM